MKIKALLYCCKAKPYLYKTEDTTYPAYPIGYHTDKDLKVKLSNTNELAYLNGKIVAECDYEVEDIENITITNINASHLQLLTNKLTEEELFKHSCLSRYEMFNYLKKGFSKADEPRGYAIHIKNLNIFDKPQRLTRLTKINWKKNIAECIAKKGKCNLGYSERYGNWIGCIKAQIDKAPQNMMRVIDWNGETKILISIQSQWMCLILNRIKDVEVRRVVLKEMLNND